MSIQSVELVRPDDFERWRELFEAYLNFYKSQLPDTIIRQTFERFFIEDINEPKAALIWTEGRAMGIVHFLFHRHTWHSENVCYLQDLFVDPDARAAGLGRALIEFVYQKAQEACAPHVYWTTQDFNYAGRTLYDQVGTKTPFIKYQGPCEPR